MEMINLFPIPIGKFKLDRHLTEDEKDYLINLDIKQNKENFLSTDSYVLENGRMQDLKKWINLKITEYYNFIYKPKNFSDIYITQSWVNYASKEESHQKHVHKNSFLSAVFYIKSNLNFGKIIFHKNNTRDIQIESEKFNEYNADSYYLGVESLDLIIFPSDLMHSVEALQSDETRISLALNTFIKGEIGDVNKLSKLKICIS
jgi:uncharacterized protein (TIGR02466 family)